MSFCTTQRRLFSIVSTLFKSKDVRSDLKPIYKPHYSNPKNEPKSFHKNLPLSKPEVKPWDAEGISKDRFFKRKYGKMSDERRQALEEKVARQRRFRAMKKEHEAKKKEKEWQEQVMMGARGKRDIYPDGPTALEIMSSNDRRGLDGAWDFNPRSGSGPGSKFDTFFEYVYGTHPVRAVLQARKRPILGLYNFKSDDRGIIKYAEKEYGVKCQTVRDKNALNILTKNGVHNGLVLKTKPLDIPYVTDIGSAENSIYTISVENELGELEQQTKKVFRAFAQNENQEEQGMDIEFVNKSGENERQNETELYPLALYLDEITDPQNIGSVLRSAYFFGVDFVIIPTHASAKLGPVANKASAGALDLLDIYQTHQNMKLIEKMKSNGWSVVSTAGRPNIPNDKLENGVGNYQYRAEKNHQHHQQQQEQEEEEEEPLHLLNKFIELSDLKTVLRRTPLLLVIGSEGRGVRTNLKNKSDFMVSIPKLRVNDDIVDSLNVGVATGVVLQNCL